MRCRSHLVATALVLFLGCRPEKDSYIVVHSNVNCDLPRVFQLRVTITNGGQVDQKVIPDAPSTELGFPSSVTLVLSGTRSGFVDLVVDAIDEKQRAVGQGKVSGTLVTGGRLDLDVLMAAITVPAPRVVVEPGQGADAGVVVDSGSSMKVDTAPGSAVPFVNFAVGGQSTCAIRGDASLWCWGSNALGQLRLSGTTDRSRPAQVSGISLTTITCGQAHACGIRNDETLSCWGNNGSGQLGGVKTVTDPPQTEVQNGPWQGVAAGSYQTCGIRTDNTLWCWGDNSNGQLGIGNVDQKTEPAQVAGTGWSQVTTSYYHTCAIKQDGTLWCWGLNANRQLGDGTAVYRTSPGQVAGSDWTQVVTGLYHTCATKQDKTLWCWGGNTAGQLGNSSVMILSPGSQDGTGAPVPVVGEWNSVSAGASHTCGIMSDQSLWCWGDNATGQIGNGGLVPVNTPVAITSLGQTWANVAAGSAHTCALATDATLWCWGDNAHGKLGADASGSQRIPTRVAQ